MSGLIFILGNVLTLDNSRDVSMVLLNLTNCTLLSWCLLPQYDVHRGKAESFVLYQYNWSCISTTACRPPAPAVGLTATFGSQIRPDAYLQIQTADYHILPKARSQLS